MIGAGQALRVAAVRAAQRGAAMSADVGEHMNAPICSPRDDHVLLAESRSNEVSGLANLALEPDELPTFHEDRFALDLEDLSTREDRAIDMRTIGANPAIQIAHRNASGLHETLLRRGGSAPPW